MKLWRLKIVPAASAKSKVCDVEKERLNGLVICMRNFDRRWFCVVPIFRFQLRHTFSSLFARHRYRVSSTAFDEYIILFYHWLSSRVKYKKNSEKTRLTVECVYSVLATQHPHQPHAVIIIYYVLLSANLVQSIIINACTLLLYYGLFIRFDFCCEPAPASVKVIA